jgi:predicted DsbA family dithiol-disulfide isomerase
LQKEFDLEVEWKGFELHPETPAGGMPLTAIIPAGRLAGMREYMKKFAAGFGIHEMASPQRISNTRRALAVAELARDQGKLQAFRDAAMEAYWHSEKNLEDDAELRAIAQGVGLDPDEALRAADDPKYLARVDAARAEANAAGVRGVPTFFIGDEVIVGCQPYEVLAAAARRAREPKS